MRNPSAAEHFLDLVNADFSDDAEVDKILDTWQEMRPDKGQSSHHKADVVDDEGQTGVTKLKRASFGAEMTIMFRRQALIITRDPILYLGRSVIFLVSNLIFGLVYLNARAYDQDQAQNKVGLVFLFLGFRPLSRWISSMRRLSFVHSALTGVLLITGLGANLVHCCSL
jgi:hypothetical protein